MKARAGTAPELEWLAKARQNRPRRSVMVTAHSTCETIMQGSENSSWQQTSQAFRNSDS